MTDSVTDHATRRFASLSLLRRAARAVTRRGLLAVAAIGVVASATAVAGGDEPSPCAVPCRPPAPIDQHRVNHLNQCDTDWPAHDDAWANTFLTRIVPHVPGNDDPCADKAGVTRPTPTTRRWSPSLFGAAPSPCVAQMLRVVAPNRAGGTSYFPNWALVRSEWFESPKWAERHNVVDTPHLTIGRREYQHDPFGFDAVANPVLQMSPGDFLPVGATLGANTEPLVPPRMLNADTGWNGVTRPVLDGVVDLVTGLPVIKMTDLELPFAGSTFRLVRTRSGRSEYQVPTGVVARNASSGEGASKLGSHWHWAGLGWMAGENPILLIDSKIPDIVGSNPTTAYFIPDATRSIPFQQLAGTSGSGVRYEAPPRFRATLRGVSVANGGTFEDGLFDEYEVSLYDGELTYRFVTVREKLPEQTHWEPWLTGNTSEPPSSYTLNEPQWVRKSMHEPPSLERVDANGYPDPYDHRKNRGLGVPYYALCTKITDRYGHEVRIEYCESPSRAMDNNTSESCACQRDCLAIGQIRSIKLVQTGSTEKTIWTLVYAHRRFGGIEWNPALYDVFTGQWIDADPERYSVHGYNMIDRIYVYEGDVPDVILNTACLTIPWNKSAGFDGGQGTLPQGNRFDALNDFNEPRGGGERLPINWRYLVSYNYATHLSDRAPANPVIPLNGADVTRGPHAWCDVDIRAGTPLAMPILIGTTIRTSESGSGEAGNQTTRRRVYHYNFEATSTDLLKPAEFDRRDVVGRMMLRAVYEEEDIARAAQSGLLSEGAPVAQAPRSIAERIAYRIGGDDKELGQASRSRLDKYASLRLEPYETGVFSGGGSNVAAVRPTLASLTTDHDDRRAYVNAALADTSTQFADHLVMHEGGVVGFASVGSGAERRFYRTMQIAVYPYAVSGSASGSASPLVLGLTVDESGPMPSAWFAPYQWHAYPRPTSLPGGRQLALEDFESARATPKMDEPRWIAIVDEFDSWAAMTSTFDPGDTDSADDDINAVGRMYDSKAYKPGLLSRRVVQMNAAGFVLRDKTWQFVSSGDGPIPVVTISQGIGPEASYKTVKDYLLSKPGQGPIDETFDPAPGADNSNYIPKSLLNEIIYVEHRGLGWSVADVSSFGGSGPNQGNTNGVVTRFHYNVFRPSPVTDDPREWQGRLQQVAQSIAKGTTTTDYYTAQTVRDPVSPRDVKAQVQFTTPRSALLSESNVPAAGTLPLDGTVMTWFNTIRDAEKRIVATTKIESPRQLRPGGAWYYPLDRQVMNTQGQTVWSISGLVRNALNPQAEVSGGEELQSLFFTYSKYDSSGRLIASVADATSGTSYSGPTRSAGSTPIGASGTVPTYPDVEANDPPISASGLVAWTRIASSDGSPSVAALNYTTVYVYDGGVLRDVYYPSAALGNGPGRAGAKRQSVRDIEFDPDPTTDGEWDHQNMDACERVERYTFNNMMRGGGGQNTDAVGPLVTQSLAERAIYRGKTVEGSPVRVEKGRLGQAIDPDSLPPLVDGNPSDLLVPSPAWFQVCAGVEVERDATGKIRNVAELDFDPVSGEKIWHGTAINDLGEVYRERAADGTITRKTKNSLGHHLRTYIGTIDDAWGTRGAAAGVAGSINYNMILTERFEYGTGIHDAWLPVAHRKYVSNEGIDWARSDYYGTPLASDDTDGIATVTKYDWRMRPVVTISYEKGALTTGSMPPRTGTTLTYLDFLGRPILVASYGAGMPPSGIQDPSASSMEPSTAPPSSISAFYPSSGEAPLLSLVGSIYGPDGSVVETRRYDIAPLAQQGGSPRSQSEYRYVGLGGKEVFSRRPSAPVTVTMLDALGRTALVKTVAPNNSGEPYTFELARSESIYDADGNVIEEIRFERTLHDGAAGLVASASAGNAIVSRTYSWYDTENRRVAWAEMPTSTVALAVPSSGTTRPVDQQPMWNGTPALPSALLASVKLGKAALADARISLQIYDNAGLVVSSISPSGAVTRNAYDKGNRLIAKSENIFSGLGSGASVLPDARLTKYEYKLGKLKAIIAPGAVTSGNLSTDMPLVAQANGNGDQRTVVTYGADVVAWVWENDKPSYKIVSANNTLVGAMRLPNPATGEVNEETDAASITLRYTFTGQIAERIDARGCTFRYFYDDQDRLAQIEIGKFTVDTPSGGSPALVFEAGYPLEMLLPGLGAPVDRVGFIEYSYDASGRMSEAKAYVQRGGLLISHNQFAYDSRGNLTKDAQSHGREITSANAAATPATTYEWEYAPTGPLAEPAGTGFSRLLKIGYPAQPNAPPNSQPRSLMFSYGDAGAGARTFEQVNHVLSRVDTIASSKAPLDIASFDYTGTDRRVGTIFAGGGMSVTLRPTTPSTQPAHALPGLDGFGRIRDLHYVNSQNVSGSGGQKQTLFRAEYGYDDSGNRLWQRTTRVDAAGLPLANFNSQSHQYDGLDRLIGSRVGTLNASGVVPEAPSGSAAAPFRFDTWNLDALGNPNGRFGTGTIGGGDFVFTFPGRLSGGNLDAFGTPWASVLMAPADVADDASSSTWQTDRRNRLTQLARVSDVPGTAASGSGGGVGSTWPFNTVQPRYDAAGNCTFDGSYFYQYDAWNRLVQINAIAAQQIAPDGEGMSGGAAPLMGPGGTTWGVGTPTETTANVAPGLLVKHFTYDGLGRLIRTQSPWPNAQQPDGTVRTEKFYYDGIRRVQEVIVDPVRIIDLEGGELGDAGDGEEITPAMRALAQQHGGDGSAAAIAGQGQSPSNVDGSSSTSSFETAQTNAGANNVTPGGGNVGGIELSNAWMTREYVWGPGGSFVGAPVDELLVQIDGEGRAGWIIQDAGGDVVAVAVNAVGASGGLANGSDALAATGVNASNTGTNLSFRVAAQQEYGAYGEVVWAEHLLNHPALHLGHKGLFVDRLDLGISEGSGGLAATGKTFGEPPRVVPLAFNLAQNRNRTLHVGMQRYLQLDPNASGAAVLSVQMMRGTAVSSDASSLDLLECFGDGANLYEYLGTKSLSRYDPLGLSSDPFDMIDEIVAEHAASTAAFMEQIRGGFSSAGHIAFQIAQMHPAIGASVAIYNIAAGGATLMDALSLIPGGKALSLFTKASKTLAVSRAAYGANKANFVGRRMDYGRQVLTITPAMAQHIGKVGSYADMKVFTKGTNHALEAHHIIPTRYLDQVPGLTKDSAPAVVMAYDDHRVIEAVLATAELEVLGSRRFAKDIDEVRRVLERAYRDAPEYWNEIKGHLR